MEATYLAWLDITPSGLTSEKLSERLINHRLMLNAGTMYGAEGEGFIRINLATQRKILEKAVAILLSVLKSI